MVINFDTWAAEHRVERLDLVKLDVEGAELAALQGMAGALTRLRPRALLVEVKDRVLDRAGVDATRSARPFIDSATYRPASSCRSPTRSTAGWSIGSRRWSLTWACPQLLPGT